MAGKPATERRDGHWSLDAGLPVGHGSGRNSPVLVDRGQGAGARHDDTIVAMAMAHSSPTWTEPGMSRSGAQRAAARQRDAPGARAAFLENELT